MDNLKLIEIQKSDPRIVELLSDLHSLKVMIVRHKNKSQMYVCVDDMIQLKHLNPIEKLLGNDKMLDKLNRYLQLEGMYPLQTTIDNDKKIYFLTTDILI